MCWYVFVWVATNNGKQFGTLVGLIFTEALCELQPLLWLSQVIEGTVMGTRTCVGSTYAGRNVRALLALRLAN